MPTRHQTKPKILVVIQCCKTKDGTEQFLNQNVSLLNFVPRTGHILQAGVTRFRTAFNFSAPRVTALSLYNGRFYNMTRTFRTDLARAVLSGQMDLVIMSAGYGLVHAFQHIHPYENEMRGSVTSYWLKVGLPCVLAEYVYNIGVEKVFGIFSRTAGYKTIFEKASWKSGSLAEAGYLYLAEGSGTSSILQAQGDVLRQLLKNQFTSMPNQSGNLPVSYKKLFP